MPVEREWVKSKLEKRVRQATPKGQVRDNRQAVTSGGAAEKMPQDANFVFDDITSQAILPGD